MKPGLLLGPPKPPSPWPLYLAIGLIWSASVVGGWTLGAARQYRLTIRLYDDARAAQGYAERCIALTKHLIYDAERATYYVENAAGLYREMIEYADMMRGRLYVAGVGP